MVRSSALATALMPFAWLLLPVGLYFALFHPATLDIANAGWLLQGTDNGENALGLHAWLHDEDAGLALSTELLGAPFGTPLLFTDSNPLLALIVAPFTPLLPPDAQFVGWWVLVSLYLHLYFARRLLAPYAPGDLALWAGAALMTALPTLFNRFVHVNLMAHWLILWALWLFLDPKRARDNRWWIAPIALATLVHAYLLVMVAAIWGSAMLAAFVAARGAGPRIWLVASATGILAMVAVLAWWLGAGGAYDLTGSYGAFAMPIDALWNPGNPSYSNFLPAIEQREGRGFEGFQYLGLGLLLLMPLALFAAVRDPAPRAQRGVFRRLAWLLPALIVLTAVAVSNHPDFAGQRLPRFLLPDFLAPMLDMVRASGRLFWPVAYTLVFAAILLAYRMKRARVGLALTALLAIQMVDLAGMFTAIRGTSAMAQTHRLYDRTPDPRWDDIIRSSRDVAFVPADVTGDLELYQEIAWRAVKFGRPMRNVYAARISRQMKARDAADAAHFERGALDPRRLYILGRDIPVPPEREVTTIDGVRVILPELRS
ncbi:MAG: hypothetical protein CMN73_07460 [Sphingomonas sp.]|nr:hypothetical protein [Sphingomonas sp.]